MCQLLTYLIRLFILFPQNPKVCVIFRKGNTFQTLTVCCITVFQTYLEEHYHSYMSSISVLITCYVMMLIIARDPDIAIFVKTVTNVQKNLLKFALGFIWLFIGKIMEPFIISLHDHPKKYIKNEAVNSTLLYSVWAWSKPTLSLKAWPRHLRYLRK